MTHHGIVLADYQGQAMTFNEYGWFSKIDIGEPVIYCVFFSHGLMKVGMSKNFNRRVKEIDPHGIFSAMFRSAVVFFCPADVSPRKAELLTLKALSQITSRVSQEVFQSINHETLAGIVEESFNLARNTRRDKRISSYNDFETIFKITGLREAYLRNAYRLSWQAAIDFVMDVESSEMGVESMLNRFDDLSPHVAQLVSAVFMRNAILLGQGFDHNTRKAALVVFAAEQRRPALEAA